MTQKRAHIQMKQGRAGQVYVCVSYHKERRRGRERANEERVQRTFPTGKRLQRLQLDLLSVLGLCFCFPHWHSYQKTCVLGQRLNCILSRLFLVAKFECACNSPFTNSPFAIPPQKRQRIFFVDRYHHCIAFDWTAAADWNAQAEAAAELQSLQGQRPRQKQNGEKASRIESIFIYLHIYGHKWS